MSPRAARVFPWLVVVVAGVMYGLSLTVPAVDAGVSINGAPGQPFVITGGNAYFWAWTLRFFVWLANPLVWAAAGLLLLRLWVPAATLALFAFWLAAWEAIENQLYSRGSVFQVGYWLWTLSPLAVAAGAVTGWWFAPPECHTRPRDLMRGWRKVPTVLVPAACVAVLVVLWFDVFGLESKPAVTGPTVSPKTVAGVIFEIEEGPGETGSASWSEDRLTARQGSRDVRFWDGTLTVNGADYGKPAVGDTVRVRVDGTVLVNGQPVTTGRPGPPP
jgi:hypothetical protein